MTCQHIVSAWGWAARGWGGVESKRRAGGLACSGSGKQPH